MSPDDSRVSSCKETWMFLFVNLLHLKVGSTSRASTHILLYFALESLKHKKRKKRNQEIENGTNQQKENLKEKDEDKEIINERKKELMNEIKNKKA